MKRAAIDTLPSTSHRLLVLLLGTLSCAHSDSLPSSTKIESPETPTRPDPVVLQEFLTKFRPLIFQAQLGRHRTSHHRVLNRTRDRYDLLLHANADSPIQIAGLPIPPQLEIINSPRDLAFLPDGSIGWEGPDVDPSESFSAQRGDLTVQLRNSSRYGLIDFHPSTGRIQILVKVFQ